MNQKESSASLRGSPNCTREKVSALRRRGSRCSQASELRVKLDQPPPTEPGWYFYTNEECPTTLSQIQFVGAFLGVYGKGGRNWPWLKVAAIGPTNVVVGNGRWSRRLDLLAPKSANQQLGGNEK